MLNYFKYFLKYRILTGILTIKFYKLNNNEWNINNNIKIYLAVFPIEICFIMKNFLHYC
jgi:hypothetical protein